MAKTEFILQGFTAKTHIDAVTRLFDIKDIKRVLISVAFANKSGVDLIAGPLKKHHKNTTVFIGIRNEITSIQGAKQILELGASLVVVDTGLRHLLFHPKLYLVRGAKHARLIVGSANLTTGGLNNNVEASVLIDLDLNKADELELVKEVEKEFDSLRKNYPAHVVAIKNSSVLESLEKAGRLIDEATVSSLRAIAAGKSPTNDPLPRIKLKVVPLSGKAEPQTVAKAKAVVPRARKHKSAPALSVPALGVEYERLWQSKPLMHRDLDIPYGKNSNRTKSISLDKGLLPDAVDHRHYFRDEVFPALTWNPGTRKSIEESYAQFQLVLKGISYGEFKIRLSHTTDKNLKTYRQKNAMTRLGWGDMRDYIAREDLLGRTLSLYRDNADPTRFLLEID